MLYGQFFITAHVGSNGHCTFGTSNDTFKITCPPPFGGGGNTKVLAPYWVDQTAFQPNGVFTTTTGSGPNRIFYIEWRTRYFGSFDSLNYEIALFENGTPAFEYIYNTINPASTGNDSELVVGQKLDENCFTVFGCDTTGGGSPPVSSGQALMAIAGPPPVQTVTSTADAGGICPGASCTLRQAIATAVSGTTITFAANVRGTINLTSGELLINKNLTINGPGANLLSVQRSAVGGTPAFRIFNITPNSVFAAISGLTIANGNSPSNGGGISNTGVLTISNSTISGNSTGSSGGGIVSSDNLNVVNSTVSGNSATGGFGGGIYSTNTVNITSSTISGNSATEPSFSIGSGGGMHNAGGAVTLTNSTVSGNTAQFRGGGIMSPSGTLTSRNTIIAFNTAPSGGPDVFGALTSQGFNLIGNNSGATIMPAQLSDQIGTPGSPINPLLGPLQNNGGPTLTRALLSGSPALDKGHSSGSTTDQRGFPRTFDNPMIPNATGGDGTDIGAFELFPPFAVSRKLHGAAVFDIALPLTGTAGIECRTGGANGDHQVIMTFPSLVTVASTSVTTGTGSVSGFTVNGGQVTVNLTGVTNAQAIILTLFGVNNGTTTSNVTVPMGVLLGDTNGDSFVNCGRHHANAQPLRSDDRCDKLPL